MYKSLCFFLSPLRARIAAAFFPHSKLFFCRPWHCGHFAKLWLYHGRRNNNISAIVYNNLLNKCNLWNLYLAIRKGRTVHYEIWSQPLKTPWWQRDTKIFVSLSFWRDRPNAKCLPFWVRVNCDNTKSVGIYIFWKWITNALYHGETSITSN